MRDEVLRRACSSDRALLVLRDRNKVSRLTFIVSQAKPHHCIVEIPRWWRVELQIHVRHRVDEAQPKRVQSLARHG